jgi:hypothetical protein
MPGSKCPLKVIYDPGAGPATLDPAAPDAEYTSEEQH